jgi:PAB-dependent poly(A)-specific ribonuclease subunit 2
VHLINIIDWCMLLIANVLSMNIQQDTHDSIEDARTAMLLYQKYRELVRNGTLQQTLHELQRTGLSKGFKV